MNDIFDYMKWRGDISFDQVPICDVDFAVFCTISYLPFDGIVSSDFREGAVNLATAIGRIIELAGPNGDGRKYHMKEDPSFVVAVRGCARYSSIKISGFVNKIDPVAQEQFCACTIVLPDDKIVVVYRGTDKSMIGWKEDFNLGFLNNLPAQVDAVQYLESAARCFRDRIYIAGHSKGGNLAMYAGAFAQRVVQERIISVVNLDGPGFNEEMIAKEGFNNIKPKIKTFVPQGSVVGMLLEHAEKHSIIHSNGQLLMQHSLYTWEVARGSFVPEVGLTDGSIMVDAAVKEWVRQMDIEQRSRMIDGVYELIVEAGITTVPELYEGKNLVTIVKLMNKMAPEKREVIVTGYKLLARAMKKNIPLKFALGKVFLKDSKDAPDEDEDEKLPEITGS